MTISMRGSNLAGGDTPYTGWTSSVGPVSGQHYLFVSNADVDYLLSKGCNCFRLLFTWEAVQPTPYATIGAAAGNFKIYWDTFKSRVDYITSKGATCIIDVHPGVDADFAAYFGAKIGTGQIAAYFENLWYQLAGIFKGNPKVAFGIMNEPHDMLASVWYSCAQTVINSIRKQGATNLIVMPGVDWTGAGTWNVNSGPGWDAAKLTDPANNMAVQVHLYLDANAGGGATDIVNANIGVTRLKVAVDWAWARGLRVFVGEVGLAASNSLAAAAWRALTDYMNANSDTVLGFCWWSYGPPAWWGGYKFTLCQQSGADSLQMKLIASTLSPPVDPTVALQAQIASLQKQVDWLTGQVVIETAAANAADAQVVDLNNQLSAVTEQRDDLQVRINEIRNALLGLP